MHAGSGFGERKTKGLEGDQPLARHIAVGSCFGCGFIFGQVGFDDAKNAAVTRLLVATASPLL
jgi:hypothetical protein